MLVKIKIKLLIFWDYTINVLTKEIDFKAYFKSIKKVNSFLRVLKYNKVMDYEGKKRIDLYIPFFKSKAFKTSVYKYLDLRKDMTASTVLLNITNACLVECTNYYEQDNSGVEHDVDIDVLIKVINQLQELEVSFFNIEGGEPFLKYDRLKKLCDAVDKRSEIWINSTGYNMTLESVKNLNVDGFMFSYSPYKSEILSKQYMYDNLLNGINICQKLKIPFVLNVSMSREDFHNGTFETILENAKEFGAIMVQITKPKSTGGWIEDSGVFFSEEDLKVAYEKVLIYNTNFSYKEYPAISAQINEDDKKIFGCNAFGVEKFCIDANGDIQPCEILKTKIGNIQEDDFISIYNHMRKIIDKPVSCAACKKACHELNINGYVRR